MNAAPLARILLRYIAAAMITYGLAPREGAMLIANDPELADLLAIALGAIIAAAAEGYYALAKRFGWRT
ncbi:hypothetical protein BVG79_01702 [Ketogulonicigenium robustum]|uniref:Uncharacterized protein n=1 Tax=Ketogulonicigenium robustum TaxID=92947 RepID=A0A1W6P0K3_9RHOB|nr:hypothetical protein [Ketogulonicigenium robustum]ARO15046.1 hypothetical protein BVG79_01702 [Ketogulonicigenium robustum]